MPQAKECADALGNGGGNGGGTHAPTEHGNEQQIQYHIDTGGKNQIVEGVFAVAHCVEDSHGNIIHHGKYRTAEVIAKIGDGLRQYICGSTHPL